MKQQPANNNPNNQYPASQYQQPPLPRKPQHPEEQYSVQQIFSIRKQSSNLANEQIYKRLTKSFHKIKKLRADPNSATLIAKEYDYEANPVRLVFKRAHDLYNQATKTNQIVKRKIDKMRGKVDRIKDQLQGSELSLIAEVDINKIFARGATNATNSQGQGANNNGNQQQTQQQSVSTNQNAIKQK